MAKNNPQALAIGSRHSGKASDAMETRPAAKFQKPSARASGQTLGSFTPNIPSSVSLGATIWRTPAMVMRPQSHGRDMRGKRAYAAEI